MMEIAGFVYFKPYFIRFTGERYSDTIEGDTMLVFVK
jgi:hypothetical protein